MSRLAAAMQQRDTGERVRLMEPFRYVKVDEEWKSTNSFMVDEARRYEFSATFATSVVIRDSQRNAPSAYEATRIAKQRVLHEVFGEYVPPLYEVMHALNDYDLDRARSLIEAVIKNFEEPTPFKEKRT